MQPMEIEQKSMAIIESELPHALDPEQAPIIKRVIHTTADFSFADSLYFSPGSIGLMRKLLQSGATVVTDTNMALAGINKQAAGRLGFSLLCLMADADVAAEAKARGETRAYVSMERALLIPGKKIFVCGNAPTFLWPLIENPPREDTAVIAVPVGFVNVVETKERVKESALPAIIAMGRRGGSNVAAAIMNALMYGVEGVRK